MPIPLHLSAAHIVLLCSLCLLSRPALAQAQAESTEAQNAYVVWGQSAPSLDRPGTALDSNALENNRSESLAQALEQIPNIVVNTGSRGEPTVHLRGFDQRQTLILIDGAPAYMAYDAQLNLGMVPPEMIERVEIYKGPQALTLGPGAMGGAINIITRSPGTKPRALISLSHRGLDPGNHAQAINAYVDRRIGPWSLAISTGLKQRSAWPLSMHFVPGVDEDGGPRSNSVRILLHVGGQVGWQGKDASLQSQVYYLRGKHGAPPSTVPARPRYWRFNDWQLLSAQAHWQQALGSYQLEQQLYTRQLANQVDAYDNANYRSQTSARAFRSRYDDAIVGSAWRLHSPAWFLGGTILRAQAELRLQQDLHHDQDLPLNPDCQTRSATRLGRSLLSLGPQIELFSESDWRFLAALQISAETRQSLTSALGRQKSQGLGALHAVADPVFSARYFPFKSIYLDASVAHRTRFPTLKEQASGGFDGLLANPDLHAEQAWHFGLDASWRANAKLQLQASLFDAEVLDLIEEVLLPDAQRQLQNIAQARLWGAELVTHLQPSAWLAQDFALSWISARRLDRPEGEDPIAGQPDLQARWTTLLRTPRNKLPIDLRSTLRWVGARPDQDPRSLAWQNLDPYLRWDLRLSYQRRRDLALWLQIDNLLDSDAQGRLGYPLPGREIWIGMRLGI